MRFTTIAFGLEAMMGLLASAQSPKFPNEDLILCDCGIGDNPEHPTWSTSRQMNWYKDIQWPQSAYSYPDAPDQSVEVPYNDGAYPWLPVGATAKLPNGDIWTAYVEDGTPDGFKAGNAVSSQNRNSVLNCWAYRGRPVSAALNKTISEDAVCWTAFVCNRDDHPPPHPKDMGSHTSSLTTQSSAPATSFYSQAPTATDGQPAPTQAPHTGNLFVSASVNPRFINWNNTWESFISNFAWDQNTGRCVGTPVKVDGYTLSFDCAGVKIDADSHMTLVLIRALHDAGLKSLWFNANPVIPGNSTAVYRRAIGGSTNSWVVLPEAASLQAVDVANNRVVGYVSYNTTYDQFLSQPCSTCDTSRFNSDFFDPIITALQGTYPVFNSYNVQAQCSPWMVCE